MPFAAQEIKSARLHLQRCDPVMKAVIKRVGPFTGRTTRDRFATLAKSIVSQQISTSAARTIQQRLSDLVSGNPGTNFSVDAIALAKFTPEQLREAGVSNQKANYLLDLAAKVNAGTLNLAALHRLDDEAVINELTTVKGIGRWTAQMFLMFCLGRMDVFPVGDLGIRNAMELAYDLEESPTADQMRAIAQPWRPYASVASWYLWKSLE